MTLAYLIIGAQLFAIALLSSVICRVRGVSDRAIRDSLGTGQSDWIAEHTADSIVRGIWK
jgi:hypothetical protein